MHCPRDHTALQPFALGAIALDRCPDCAGMWLDYSELDQLEDSVFSDDDFKGTLVFRDESTALRCPICDEPLRQFKYRLHDLVLDHCPNHHGFWLDAGEHFRIIQLLNERAEALKQKIEAEREWAKALNRFRSPSFLERLRALLS